MTVAGWATETAAEAAATEAAAGEAAAEAAAGPSLAGASWMPRGGGALDLLLVELGRWSEPRHALRLLQLLCLGLPASPRAQPLATFTAAGKD